MKLKNTLLHSWPFVVRKFLFWAAFITNITFFIFFKDKGIWYFEASILLSLLTIMPIVSEIPTGVFADTHGRKKSVLLSIFIEFLCLIAIIFSDSFPILAGIFVLWWIGATFASGAVNAWAIDRFTEEHKEAHIENYFAINSSAYSAWMVVAWLLSSFLLTYSDQNSVWWFRTGLTFTSFLVLLFVREKFENTKNTEESGYDIFMSNLKEGISALLQSKTLLLLIGAELLLSIALFLVSWAAMQSFFLSAWLKENTWWSIYSATAFVTIFVPIIAMNMARMFKKKSNYLVLILIAQAALFALTTIFTNSLYAVFLLFFYNISEDLFNPVSSAFFQKHISAKLRATIESLQSAILGLGYGIWLLVGGYVSEHFSWSIVMMGSVIFFLGSAALYRKSE